MTKSNELDCTCSGGAAEPGCEWHDHFAKLEAERDAAAAALNKADAERKALEEQRLRMQEELTKALRHVDMKAYNSDTQRLTTFLGKPFVYWHNLQQQYDDELAATKRDRDRILATVAEAKADAERAKEERNGLHVTHYRERMEAKKELDAAIASHVSDINQIMVGIGRPETCMALLPIAPELIIKQYKEVVAERDQWKYEFECSGIKYAARYESEQKAIKERDAVTAERDQLREACEALNHKGLGLRLQLGVAITERAAVTAERDRLQKAANHWEREKDSAYANLIKVEDQRDTAERRIAKLAGLLREIQATVRRIGGIGTIATDIDAALSESGVVS